MGTNPDPVSPNEGQAGSPSGERAASTSTNAKQESIRRSSPGDDNDVERPSILTELLNARR